MKFSTYSTLFWSPSCSLPLHYTIHLLSGGAELRWDYGLENASGGSDGGHLQTASLAE